jgi:CheY-like chemotaxis protein
MRVLIVQSNESLGLVWRRHLERLGVSVTSAATGSEAVDLIETHDFDCIVLDLILGEGNALTVADVAYFRQPGANVIFVTDTTFFSDGSIFTHSAKARAFVEKATPPTDLAAIVHHYGEAASRDHAAHESLVAG